MTPKLISEGEVINGSSTNGYYELNGIHDNEILNESLNGSYTNGHNELNGIHDESLFTMQGFGTRAIHIGQEPDPYTGAVIPPISLSTTFKQSSIGNHKGYEYSRSSNPTRSAFEQAIASLEKGKYGIAFSSGSAVTATIVTTIGTGGHIISVNDVYGGTNRYFSKVASTQGISTTFTDLLNPHNIESAFRPDTKIVWVETPTNPTLRLVDIQKVAQITHNHGAILVVDNTFMSPYFQNPLELGADIVVHSVTKYINGHSDVVMGVAVMNDNSIYEKLRFLQNAMGAVPSPFDSWLANRGLKTLHVRMRQHQENALAIGKFLENNDKVEEVIYPGLESHPQHDLAKKQAKGFGGMLSFRIKGGFEAADSFLRNIKLFTLAESLGGVESLAEHPAKMTHAALTPEHREAVGVTDNLIRLSVGIEEVTDLIADLQQALEIAVPNNVKRI
ncbi:5291_t:CDS:2 [Gigaspora margarita]|uniref:cystathionine gamma-lyase n=2 Tax=Gigaspora margarita TaxID=4874 RepID=A0A8H4A226_GIGMA|nr:Cys/Met metabolism PLP-dependent enzyme-domain-containing protein [Gigaspora margarita]CAG8675475.1 5291_t:CDS:2 [Gigaspora margarita]